MDRKIWIKSSVIGFVLAFVIMFINVFENIVFYVSGGSSFYSSTPVIVNAIMVEILICFIFSIFVLFICYIGFYIYSLIIKKKKKIKNIIMYLIIPGLSSLIGFILYPLLANIIFYFLN